ncbi:MAG: phytase, partial [Armatimonadetes bacterium]|nr:phytase [Armatimonadota bacterium]
MTHLIRPAASVLLALLFGAVSVGAPASFPLEAAVSTDPVRSDADDPALWRHPTDASLSLVLGTDKGDTDGALCVFDLQGRLRQEIRGLLRPNNLDLE